MKSKKHLSSELAVEIDGRSGEHFIVERNGEFLLRSNNEDYPGIYLTSSKVNSIEIARKLATNYIMRERGIGSR